MIGVVATALEAVDAGAQANAQGAQVLIEIALEVEGEIFAGRARARDILPCCIAAYIDALSNAQAVQEVRRGRGEPVLIQSAAEVCAA